MPGSVRRPRNCTGSDDEYRIDQPDDLAFLASFGVTP
jgi:hypothetical protein